MKKEAELMTIGEVARKLRLDRATVQRWAHEGAIDVITLPSVGRNVRYRMHRTAFNALLKDTTK
jgi:excisionase family DNA binding protein